MIRLDAAKINRAIEKWGVIPRSDLGVKAHVPDSIVDAAFDGKPISERDARSIAFALGTSVANLKSIEAEPVAGAA